MNQRPPSLDRLARYAVRIGVVVELERMARRGWPASVTRNKAK